MDRAIRDSTGANFMNDVTVTTLKKIEYSKSYVCVSLINHIGCSNTLFLGGNTTVF